MREEETNNQTIVAPDRVIIHRIAEADIFILLDFI